MLTMAILLVAGAAQGWILDPGLPSRLSESDLARGKALYAAYCQRCHGADGDDTRVEGITPLGGLSLRLGDPRNRNFGGPSFRARGRIYPPEEASALMGYILTLRGEKGFARPDALVSPHLLDRKRARRTYIVIDVRSAAEFRKGHLGNSVNVPQRTLAALGRPTLAPELARRVVVLYDDGSGLQAAKVWRTLVHSGHQSVAILDGGFKRWVAEDREITTAVSSSLPPRVFIEGAHTGQPSHPADPARPSVTLRLDRRTMVTERGFVNASEMTRHLQVGGFGGPGLYRLGAGSDLADLPAFVLHLLGYSIDQRGIDELVVR